MKLTHLDITNILGIRRAEIAPKVGSVLIAGPNGAGKSSIAEAIRLACLGEAPRGSGLKKDYGQLINQGGTAGSISIQFDRAGFSAALPGGQRQASAEISAFELCLSPERFASMEAKERRSFLFELMGIKASPTSIKERLQKRGVDAKKAAEIAPLLAGGFDAAMKESQAKAREAKASWRTITGEAYGSQKAEGWKSEAPAFDAADAAAIDRARAVIQATDETIAEANRKVGALASQVLAHKAAGKLAEAREAAEKLPRIKATLDKDRAELAEWEQKVAAADGKSEPNAQRWQPMACPHCSGVVILDFSGEKPQLVAYEQPSMHSAAEDADRLPEYRKARDLLKNAVANGERDLRSAEASQAQAAELAKEQAEAPDESDIELAQQQIADLKAQRNESEAYAQELERDRQAAQAAEGKTKQAAGYHSDVKAWDAIADALSPNGIPAELLADAIEPFNAKLRDIATLADWEQPALDAEMNLTVGGRAYAFRSESEKWRADALIAAAIAAISGAGFIMLDRFDVLDAAGRTDALYWIADLDNMQIGALALGTLKAIPQGLEKELGIAGYMIAEGCIEEIEGAAA